MSEEIIRSSASIEVKITIELTESEARALDAIVGYGPDLFVEWFYKTHGKHYLKPHENATKSLFSKLRSGFGKHFRRAEIARKAFNHPETVKFHNQS